MHANARRRSFWARALGPGGHLGLQRLVLLSLRKAEWVQNPLRKVDFSGRLARVRAGVYRTLSGCPGRLGPGRRSSRDLFSGPAARPSVHHSCFFRTLDEE